MGLSSQLVPGGAPVIEKVNNNSNIHLMALSFFLRLPAVMQGWDSSWPLLLPVPWVRGKNWSPAFWCQTDLTQHLCLPCTACRSCSLLRSLLSRRGRHLTGEKRMVGISSL